MSDPKKEQKQQGDHTKEGAPQQQTSPADNQKSGDRAPGSGQNQKK